MASRLNLLFQAAPRQFLEKTVLFTDGLTSHESAALMRDKTVNLFDFEPIKERAAARVLSSMHLYNDQPLQGYFIPPLGSIAIPRDDPPYRFVFMPEFTCSRLKIRRDGESLLRMEVEQGLMSAVPPVHGTADSIYVDSFSYWDMTKGHLVGRIRGTAVLVKERNEPWTIYMQQIVGSEGFEQVRTLFSRPLNY